MGNLFSKHPLRTWVAVVLEWAHVVTPLPDNQTLPQWIIERRWPGMTTTFFMWSVAAVGLLMCGLFVPLIRSVRQREHETKQLEAMALERQTTQHTIEKLQAKVRAIEDTQPLLRAEPFPTERIPQHDYHSGIHNFRNRIGYFALLRVTNEPNNLNSDSIAHRIHAKITYCDEQGKPLFRTVDGVWFDLDWDYHPTNIRSPRSEPESLSPHKSVYLGVALRYQWEGPHFHALCADSQKSPDWLNPEFKLSREVTYLRISMVCHGFKKDYGYVLTSRDSQQGFQLEPIAPPASDASHFSSKNESI
jgi:hypothetical protein